TGRDLGGGAEVDAAAEERAGGEHHGARAEAASVNRHDARGARAVRVQTGNHSLRELDAGESLEQRPYGATVQRAIALGSRRPHGGTLGAIEHPELDRRAIGRSPHDAAEGIDLAHHGTLRDPADGGIAGHLTDGVEVGRQEEDLRTQASGHDGRFGSGVAGTYNNHVIVVGHANKVREWARPRLDAQTQQGRTVNGAWSLSMKNR